MNALIVAAGEAAASSVAQVVAAAPRPVGAAFGALAQTTPVNVGEGNTTFWNSGLGIFVRTIAGLLAVMLIVWGIVKAVLESFKGRGGGMGQIMRQTAPMFVVAALLALITSIPTLIINTIKFPIEALISVINDQVGDSKTEFCEIAENADEPQCADDEEE